MTTARSENPNLWVHVQEPSEWCGRSKHILLTQRGWKVRKFPAVGKVFLLTFPFIDVSPQPLRSTGRKRPCSRRSAQGANTECDNHHRWVGTCSKLYG